MLGLRVDANRPAQLLPELLRKLDYLVERRHLELAVVRMRSERQALLRAERLDLGQREILAEPAGYLDAVNRLRALAIGELRFDVRRAADVVLVPCNQDAVFRRDQIGLDEVGAHFGRQLV